MAGELEQKQFIDNQLRPLMNQILPDILARLDALESTPLIAKAMDDHRAAIKKGEETAQRRLEAEAKKEAEELDAKRAAEEEKAQEEYDKRKKKRKAAKTEAAGIAKAEMPEKPKKD